jgi:hypothetical protein
MRSSPPWGPSPSESEAVAPATPLDLAEKQEKNLLKPDDGPLIWCPESRARAMREDGLRTLCVCAATVQDRELINQSFSDFQ